MPMPADQSKRSGCQNVLLNLVLAAMGLWLLGSLLPPLSQVWATYKASGRIESFSEARKQARQAAPSGTLLLETVQAGQHDIQLVILGKALPLVRTLAGSPANETSPVWSPDGQSLAYLSDQSGQPEVYLRKRSGLGVKQLTHASPVTWEGPLYWVGYQRQAIFLKGSDPASGVTAVYRIALDAAQPQPYLLPGTQGVLGPLRFQSWLESFAYTRADGQLRLYQPDSADAFWLNPQDAPRDMQVLPGGFDWIHQGWRLMYLSQGQPPTGEVGLEVRSAQLSPGVTPARSPDFGLMAEEGLPAVWEENQFYLSGRVGSIQALFSGPYAFFLALQSGDLDGANADPNCLRLHAYDPLLKPVPAHTAPLFPDTCLDALPQGLDPGSFRYAPNPNHYYDGGWLFFSGHAPGEKQSALYAVFFYKQLYLSPSGRLHRIALRLPGALVPGSIRAQP